MSHHLTKSQRFLEASDCEPAGQLEIPGFARGLRGRIAVAAASPNNAQVTRYAVVRLGAALRRGYTLLAWADRF